jgi:hypothetical protein
MKSIVQFFNSNIMLWKETIVLSWCFYTIEIFNWFAKVNFQREITQTYNLKLMKVGISNINTPNNLTWTCPIKYLVNICKTYTR